ncbi:hypothetical protein BAUCODRAFT_455511 [Baudoinia panamericana UAMH 10762]|uniref:Secreted protein n=1 Tax=Baudoinia panamericana (strain UAMH 10762) TaxID=717646 RepID=M2MLK9_BAUPA|nr:uncharacterized protein BAUCODRAFT_455511 [Baudoinia panamericana UAMH 10762]EMC97531.1 hypothetical protein BAUCODRAFT_455511 [Baudoinia panamericana UAMH 10762]
MDSHKQCHSSWSLALLRVIRMLAGLCNEVCCLCTKAPLRCHPHEGERQAHTLLYLLWHLSSIRASQRTARLWLLLADMRS